MSHTIATLNNLPLHENTHFVPSYSCLAKGGVKAFSEVGSETIHCTAGRLWVTFEGDAKDYILLSGEHLVIPNQGKVLVSGPGCYRISRGIDGMDLAFAS